MASARITRRGLLAAGGTGLAAPWLAAGPARAADGHGWYPSVPYRWSNVEIIGGGFVPGIVFNRAERNLVYARTDIGGAYRWDEGRRRWIPLLDWVGWDDWGYTG